MKYLKFLFILLFLYSCSQGPDYFYKRGNMFFISGDYYKALDMYNRSLLKDPKFAKCYVSRAMTYEKLGNREKAIEDYEKAIKLDPEYLPAYNNIASIYVEQRDFRSAFYYLNKALEMDPSYYYAYYTRGLAYYYSGEYDKSIKDFSKVITLKDYDLAYYYRAMSFYKLGYYSYAFDDINYLIDKDPNSDVLYYHMGKIKFKMNDKSCIDDFTRAININDKKDIYYYERSKAYHKFGNLKEAVKDINTAIRLTGVKNVDYIYYAGDLYLKLAIPDIAGKYYSMAYNIDKNTEKVYRYKMKELKKYIKKYGRK